MTWLFWGAVAIVAYCYFGYPAWLFLRARLRPLPVKRDDYLPKLSIVMVVRNEAAVLHSKLRNLVDLDYPWELCEIIVVSDGSTDATAHILSEFGTERRFRVVQLTESRGKAAGLNEALVNASGDVVVFTDARQAIERGALRLLMENFSDPAIGCASGELLLGDPESGEAAQGLGLYWRIEKTLRELESASGSVVGATGAFYAARRDLLTPIPADTILDDVLIPMCVVRHGSRVIFDGRAHAWDIAPQGTGREFARKVRTLTGNYQLLQLAPWLLSSENPIRFEFISHKLFRLIVPFAMACALVASIFLTGAFYRIGLVLQLAFYALAFFAIVRPGHGLLARVADAAFTFLLLNAAALVAFAKFVGGRKPVWTR